MSTRRWAIVAALLLSVTGVSAQTQQEVKYSSPEEPPSKRRKSEPAMLTGSQFIAGQIIHEDGTPADNATAVERYPEYAEAWNLLGQTRLSQQDSEGALGGTRAD